MFVQLHRSAVRGLVHISQVERAFAKELGKHYTPGQVVSVRCAGCLGGGLWSGAAAIVAAVSAVRI